jgi:hypothetical protein
MNQWVLQCNELRGLEMATLCHPKARLLLADHRQSILSCYHRNNASEDSLREISRRTSAPCTRFGRMIAIADEMFTRTAGDSPQPT